MTKPVKPLSDEVQRALTNAEGKLGKNDLDLLLGLIARQGVLAEWRRLGKETEKRAAEQAAKSFERSIELNDLLRQPKRKICMRCKQPIQDGEVYTHWSGEYCHDGECPPKKP